jgi:energy-coupling factor transport system ATP-binding protein
MAELIRLEDVFYTYMPGTPFARRALSGVSLSVDDGEAVGISGVTGSGKSTLIQHFNGLLRADSGRVWVNGVDIGKGTSGADLAEVRFSVGMLFQFPEQQLFEENVFADVAFGPRNMGLPEVEVEERVNWALELVGLNSLNSREVSPFALSGGQKRRAALAGVLAMRPKCLVLDEPTAGLDPRGARALLQMLADVQNSEKITLIMVSHHFEELAQICGRLLLINRGRVVADGSPREILYSDEAMQEAGLEPPPLCRVFSCLQRKLGLEIIYKPLTVPESVEAFKKLEEELC